MSTPNEMKKTKTSTSHAKAMAQEKAGPHKTGGMPGGQVASKGSGRQKQMAGRGKTGKANPAAGAAKRNSKFGVPIY